MKILHTSDWHLGRSLYGRKRYQEFEAFLDWLVKTIKTEEIDALLVAGDVFDNSTPSNQAQELYYRFLCRVAASCCRHVVIIAGNHDSPSFLNAPRELLRALNVYVVGAMADTLDNEVIPILDSGFENADGKDEFNQKEHSRINLQRSAIICAVPYLRDRDVRIVEPGEAIDDKSRKLVEGIQAHYAAVVQAAEQKRDEIIQQHKTQNPQSSIRNPKIPIIAMGHLFTTGGKTVDGDGVRELYVGSLAHVGEETFPAAIDYLALGHLHVAQRVGSAAHLRYCGSPLPMGFGEAAQSKSVVIIDFRVLIDDSDDLPKDAALAANKNLQPKIKLLPVPCFQQLVRITGSLEEIHAKLEELKQAESQAWLEIEYTGNEVIGTLREMLDETLAGSAMEIRRVKNRGIMEQVLTAMNEGETLDDLDVGDVFTRRLDASDVPEEARAELRASYDEVVQELMEADSNAN